MDWHKFEDLDFLAEMTDNADTCVVFFHGYGADAQDLASLSTVYKPKRAVDWYFPQGVLEVPIGPMMSGRAWFELRVSDFEKVSGGQIDDGQLDAQSVQVLQGVQRWLNHLGKLYKNVFIGGFSQGAILTSHSFYRLNFSPAGLILFSGYLLYPSQFPTLADEQKVPFFQSHGEQDMVLKVSGARKLYEKLRELGMEGTFHSFSGGHEIPFPIIEKSRTFLNSVLEKRG